MPTSSSSFLKNALQEIVKKSNWNDDNTFMAIKPMNPKNLLTEQKTDSESVVLMKNLFQQVCAIYTNSTKEQREALIKFVCAGTQHTSIPSFQSDFSIQIGTKIHRYTAAIVSAQKGIMFPNVDNSMSNQQLGQGLVSVVEVLEKSPRILQSKIDDLTKQLQDAQESKERIINVYAQDRTTLLGSSITEKHHKQLPEILDALTARNALGYPEQLYIYGAPGAGKTHLARQIAKALGVRCYAYPMGPTITEGKLLGFNNIATGTFVAGWLYEAYKQGGLVALDEADLADASVLGAANSIDNDQFIFGNGEIVQRHNNFYLIAFANTIGTGSTKGFIRNTLDAATRDRFTVIKLEYDEQLEKDIYGNADWATYVQKVRDYVTKHCQQTIYITPRATRKGAAYLAKGIPIDKVLDWCIFKGCSEDIKQNILTNVGKFLADKSKNKSILAARDFVLQFKTHPGIVNPAHKIEAIKKFQKEAGNITGKNISLPYAKEVIEQWPYFHDYVIKYGEFPDNFTGYKIYSI